MRLNEPQRLTGKQLQSKIPMYFKAKNEEKKTNEEVNQKDHLEKEETIISQKEEIIMRE